MTELKEKPNKRVKRRWKLCPMRHALSAAGLLCIAAYFLLRRSAPLMAFLSARIVRPWHRLASRALSALPFSAAEALIVVGVIAALVFIIFTIVQLIRKPERKTRLYRFFMTCLTAFALIYGGFCLLWGVYYYTSDFEAQSGLHGEPVSTQQLTSVTRYFTDLLCEYCDEVPRDAQGEFCADLDGVFAASPALYDAAAEKFPCLAGDAIAAKPFFFSRFMSYTNFTGFFFPFTGEANINVDCPPALIPSTIAHEIAHQRGIAQEDEANFAAVLSSLENGDPVWCYSACLLAYIHLGNALNKADHDAWAENYTRLPQGALVDLAANNAYWAQFETPVKAVSDTVYTGFLQSYGQSDGLKTYGKCVDLLVAYYYDIAQEAPK